MAHLAAALRDNGGGRLVTTELDDVKVEVPLGDRIEISLRG